MVLIYFGHFFLFSPLLNLHYFFQSNGFWELEGPTISPKEVWEGSGHWSTFVDKIVKCKKCLSVFRVDKLIEEKLDVDTAGMKSNDLLKYIKKLKCPSCSGEFVEKIEEESLMMKTSVGGRECGLRP